MKLECKSTVKNIKWTTNRGSSSVLVVMIMLLLITFGVLAMMSSYSNLKISRKHADWTKDYYQLESIAESEIITFKNVLADVLDRFDGRAFELESNPQIKKEIMGDFLKALLNVLNGEQYFAGRVNSNFSEYSEDSDQIMIPKLTILTRDHLTDRRLLIALNFDLNVERIEDIDYNIVEWREIPVEFEYEDTINFNDPEGN